jgi:twitching motility protein PilT
MGEAQGAGLLGRIAVHYKLITMAQLNEVTTEQARSPQKKLGEILIEKGYLDKAQLTWLLEVQRQYAEQQRQKVEAQRQKVSREFAAQAPIAPPPVPVHSPGRELDLSEEGEVLEIGDAAPPPAAKQTRPTTAELTQWDPSVRDLQAGPPAAPAPRVAAVTATAGSAAVAQVRAGPTRAVSGAPAAALPPTSSSAPASTRAQVSAVPDTPPDPALVKWLHEILRRAAEVRASDVHIHAGASIKLRRFCRLVSFTKDPLPAAQTEAVLMAALGPSERQRFAAAGQVDFAYSIAGVGRFRVNIYRQQRGTNGVFHVIPSQPPTLPELGLPSSLAKETAYHNGIVLVTGPAGCGKSSTLAALVNIINEERNDHVLTIEDPIEYIHPSKRCLVNQRQVARHTESFARALRAALREDPDVICIGELRDLETISLALSAAETGHLVLATLHTNNAIRTINRVVGVYPPSQQPQIRTMLSESLRAVVSQRLIPTADGEGVVLALELLRVNKAIGNLIRENKAFQIHSVLQTGRGQGMCLLDHSLMELYKQGRINAREAMANAEDPKPFASP